MKKSVKVSLKVLGSILLLVIIIGLGGWWYLKNTFLDYEDDYAENKSIHEITVDGYSFLDRNGNGELDIYEDARRSTSERVEDLLSQMTIEEKIHLLKGSGMASGAGMGEPGEGIPGAVGTIVPTPRLGIPTVYLSDGPAGLRIEPKREGETKTYYCTAFPIGTLLASTWNTELVQRVGRAMGNEALEYGLDVILGPGANIHRHPLCGRNFEYYSEDPVLTGDIGAAMVNGIEANGVGTSLKHFVANNQETNRNYNDAIVSDRAMREIYLRGFEIVVKKSQPWTIMSSYNLVNGTYTIESRDLLTDILRTDWGFEGLVMSDWFGGQDAVVQVSAGNDLLEPGTKRQWNALLDGYEDGSLSTEVIDTSVKRILSLIINSKKWENYQYGNEPDLEAHAAITRESASEGMILLKNENTLPLDNSMNIALLGVTSFDFIAGGTGSGDVNEAYTISLEQGLKNAGFEINSVSQNLYQKHRTSNLEQFEKPEGISAMFNPYNPPQISYNKEQLDDIVNSADLAVITIGRNSGEGGDRAEKDDFLLTAEEQDMITQTCEVFHNANKKVVVVLNIGGVIETASWKAKPDAILLAWQGGQEGGNSVADILNGSVNPSGKLPMTFPVNLNDHASNANFPEGGEPMSMMSFISGNKTKSDEEKVKDIDYTIYEEGIYVGYRHFDKSGLEVSYPFGYGLSYTSFDFNNFQVVPENDSVKISVAVTNTGDKAGKEVVEIYSSKSNTQIDRPIFELKAFGKTNLLNPGEQQILTISFRISDLAYWDEQIGGWKIEPGVYQINAGTSSRDIKLKQEILL
ncbi:glycoside hydrolase family 3 C-terminal domain-containing protein [uncultured Draconibacterium sp.]|uniref:glycoside hydrolase family 3 C-terminal domain-containing protein n=1 Tax=uncultured Draconibacterium sp. TaxID=1573823 RepID=UPI0029C6F643|nr:glycoside hydrolase family 3 C-terminal domain-containing protein [uncultured Draconibacterium sp.]